MKRRTGMVFIVTALIIGLMLSACAPAAAPEAAPAESEAAPAESAAQPEAPAGAIKRGGTLTWARGSVPENLDVAWTENNADVWVVVNILEPLVRVDATGTKIEPALAESWDVSDDGMVYTFHLRQGVKFHDGSDMTVDDVVFSLERARDNGLWNWSLSNAKSIEAVDDSTVQITLARRVCRILGRFGAV